MAVVAHLSIWDGHPAQGLVQGMGDTHDLARSCWGVPSVQPMEGKLSGSGVAPPRGVGPWDPGAAGPPDWSDWKRGRFTAQRLRL